MLSCPLQNTARIITSISITIVYAPFLVSICTNSLCDLYAAAVINRLNNGNSALMGHTNEGSIKSFGTPVVGFIW